MNQSPLLLDCHLHTDCSPDGTHTAQEMVDRAKKSGIAILALTDHCEVEQYYSNAYYNTVPMAWKAAQEQKQKQDPCLEVLVGIEVGQPGENFELADRILAAHPYDFVLASVHRLRNVPEFYYLSAVAGNIDYLWDRYFDELIRIARWGNFDCMAHLTYPLRYICGTFGGSADFSKHTKKLDLLLSLLAQNKKALEVNTAGAHQKNGFLIPTPEILERFRYFGGEYVTIGSDAHSAEGIGAGLLEGMQLILQAGFDSVTVFRNRKPHKISL